MAPAQQITFEDYIAQAHETLTFIETQFAMPTLSPRWIVTCCFYVAVPLTNAHALAKHGSYFRNHEATQAALRFSNLKSDLRWSEEAFVAYEKLSSLSRAARYLKTNKGKPMTKITLPKVRHALMALQVILLYFEQQYPYVKFAPIHITSLPSLPPLPHFQTQ